MIARVLRACAHLPAVLVASPELAQSYAPEGSVDILINEEPDRGMTHSLALANARVTADSALLVFLGDKPFVTRALADRVVRIAQEANADVCFPERDGIGGHPVYFSPAARSKIASLANGDSLQRVRDDSDLCRTAFACDDKGAFYDIDTQADQAAGRTPLDPPER